MINFSQFSATMALRGAIEAVKGGVDEELFGRLQSSVEDRNWDSIEALWKMKEEVKADPVLREAFLGQTSGDVRSKLGATQAGARFLEQRLDPYRQEFGYKSIWSHEFVFPLWKENPGPIIEAIRGYLESDYDYSTSISAVKNDLASAKTELMDGVTGDAKTQLQGALELSTNMSPLTPDHHFYIDQGTNARLRMVLVGIGDRLVEEGIVDDREDTIFLLYNELRQLLGEPKGFDAKALASRRRDEREQAFEIRPPAWLGTATVGLPGKVHPPCPHNDVGAARPAGISRRCRGRRVPCPFARRVRSGSGRRDPGLPDDESRLGGAFHQDRRPRHGCRRRGFAPRCRLTRVRHPGGGWNIGRHAADQDR